MEHQIMATSPRQSVALIDLAITVDGTRPRWETAMRRLDGLTLLEWSIRRLAEATLLDSIVITGLDESHSAIARRLFAMPSPCPALCQPLRKELRKLQKR